MAETDYERPVPFMHRRSAVQGQLSFELEGPTGFLEAPYKPERGALFFADSWSPHGRLRHLIRDTPDGLTYEGWSAEAEYRRAGRWIRIADAPEGHAEWFSPSKEKYLQDRWCLTGNRPSAGIAVAAELCTLAIDWWDHHDDGRVQTEDGPDIVDFCAVFPSLTARRTPGELGWHLCYTTDTASWTRVPGGSWSFAGRVSCAAHVNALTRYSGLERPWRLYGQLRRKKHIASTVEVGDKRHEQEALAEAVAVAAGSEFPLLLALLTNLMSAAPTGRWSFELLSKYSAINAQAGVDLLAGQNVGQLHVQNDICRWVARGERWMEVKRERRSKSTISIELPQLAEAALSLAANPTAASPCWADELQSTQTWVVTDTEAEYEGDFPIYDVVRGTSRNSSGGWGYSAYYSGWIWQKVEELRYDHHLPRWEGDDRICAEKTVIPVSDTLGLLLLEYERVDSPRAHEAWDPMWSDFLHWVQSES